VDDFRLRWEIQNILFCVNNTRCLHYVWELRFRIILAIDL
jgi:hypothetical protein